MGCLFPAGAKTIAEMIQAVILVVCDNTVLLISAVHCPKWFLSLGSLRLHSIQVSGQIPMR